MNPLPGRDDSARPSSSRRFSGSKRRGDHSNMVGRPRRRKGFRNRRREEEADGWIHGEVMTLGLTGSIGGGKSAVAEILASTGRDVFVLDADKIGHVLLNQRPCREAVAARFGSRIIEPPVNEGDEPTVNRSVLGKIVFGNAAALEDLERILHPRMRKTFEKAIARAARDSRIRLVVLDAPILLEAGWNDLCDRVVFVDAPFNIRSSRVRQARRWSDEELKTRELTQWPVAQKKDEADFVIDNSGSLETLRGLVLEFRDQLSKLSPTDARQLSIPSPE